MTITTQPRSLPVLKNNNSNATKEAEEICNQLISILEGLYFLNEKLIELEYAMLKKITENAQMTGE